MTRVEASPVSLALTDQISLSGSSLTLPSGLTYDEWLGIGRKLMLADKAVQWAIGDWWVYGDHAYGERASAAIDPATGENRLTRYMDYGWVARSIETSRRREVLSWSSHKEVASLEPDIQDAILERAVQNGWGSREIRAAVREFKDRMARGNKPKLSSQTPIEDAEIISEDDDTPIADKGSLGSALRAEDRREVLDAMAEQKLSSANQRLLHVIGLIQEMRKDETFRAQLDYEGLSAAALQLEGQYLVNLSTEARHAQNIGFDRKPAPKVARAETGAGAGEGDGKLPRSSSSSREGSSKPVPSSAARSDAEHLGPIPSRLRRVR